MKCEKWIVVAGRGGEEVSEEEGRVPSTRGAKTKSLTSTVRRIFRK